MMNAGGGGQEDGLGELPGVNDLTYQPRQAGRSQPPGCLGPAELPGNGVGAAGAKALRQEQVCWLGRGDGAAKGRRRPQR